MKKLAILILTIVMATSLVGCDKFSKKEEKETKKIENLNVELANVRLKATQEVALDYGLDVNELEKRANEAFTKKMEENKDMRNVQMNYKLLVDIYGDKLARDYFKQTLLQEELIKEVANKKELSKEEIENLKKSYPHEEDILNKVKISMTSSEIITKILDKEFTLIKP